MLDRIKHLLRDQLGLPVWAIFLFVGIASHLLLNAFLRKPLTSPCGLLAPLVLGLLIESYEVWLQYRDVGLLAEGHDPLWMIVARHGQDVATLLAIPLLLVVAGMLSSR